MAVNVDAVKSRALAVMKGFSPAQLVIIGLLSVVGVTGAVFFLKWVSTPTYGVLLAGLDPKDAAAVTAKLQGDGVAYKLGAGGTTVLVPQGSMDKERIAVAAAGLPAGSTSNGWAAFDKQGLTSSSFQQQVAYQRAMETTLADTLQGITGVRSAQVHLALPEQRLFSQEQQPARAAVLVQTDGTLPAGTVEAMTHLVSSAVPSMDPKDVTITDGSGTLLTGDAVSSNRLDQTRSSYEDALASQVTSMFDTLLGPGHAVVRVNAQMNTSNTTVDSQVYDPKKTVPLSQSQTTEKYAPGTATTTAGVVSSVPTPGATTTTTGSGANGYTKTEAQSTNGVSVTTSHEVIAPGGVKRLTVAVAVDSAAKNAPAVAAIQSMVANAVGLDPTRGDTISVTTPAFLIPSTKGKAASAAGTPSMVGQVTSRAPQVLGGVLLLIVALGLLKALRRGVATDLPADQVTALVEARKREAVLGRTALGLPAGSIPAQRGTSEDLTGALDGDPDQVAGLLRGWLASAGTGD